MGTRTFRPPPPPEWRVSPDDLIPGGHYVVACWGGKRRKGGEPDEILESHLDALREVGHSLAQVTLCVPECDEEKPAFRKLLRSLPNKIQDARVRLFERPNRGLSYGSWSDACQIWGSVFRWHFFMEDDFVFCRDGFDEACIELLVNQPVPVALCGGVSDCGTYAEVGNMVVSEDGIQHVRERHGGKIPHVAKHGYKGDPSQSVFGQGFWRAGVPMIDLREYYGVSFGEADGARKEWPHEKGWIMVSIEHWRELRWCE